jgi:hypothetical protein
MRIRSLAPRLVLAVLAGALIAACGSASVKPATKTTAATTSHAGRSTTGFHYSGPSLSQCVADWNSSGGQMQTILGVASNAGGDGALVVGFTDGECGVAVDIPGQESVPSTFVQTQGGWTVLGGNGGNAETELEVSSDLVTLASKSTNATVSSNGQLEADPGRSILALGITSTGAKASASGVSGDGAASATPGTTAANGGPSGPAPSDDAVDDEAFVSPSGNIECVNSIALPFADGKPPTPGYTFAACESRSPQQFVELHKNGQVTECKGAACPTIGWSGALTTLAYGDSEGGSNSFSCASQTTGVTCTATSGAGFTIARSGITRIGAGGPTTVVDAPVSTVDAIVSSIEDGNGWSSVPNGIVITVKVLKDNLAFAGVSVAATPGSAEYDSFQSYTTIYHLTNRAWVQAAQGEVCDGGAVTGLSAPSLTALCEMGVTPKKVPANGTTSKVGAGKQTSQGTECGTVRWDGSTMTVLYSGAIGCPVAMKLATVSAAGTTGGPDDNDYSTVGGMLCNEKQASVSALGISCGTQSSHVLLEDHAVAPLPLAGASIAGDVCASEFVSGIVGNGDVVTLPAPTTDADNVGYYVMASGLSCADAANILAQFLASSPMQDFAFGSPTVTEAIEGATCTSGPSNVVTDESGGTKFVAVDGTCKMPNGAVAAAA